MLEAGSRKDISPSFCFFLQEVLGEVRTFMANGLW